MKNKTFRGGEDTMDRKILIVDDEKNIVDIIAFNLKKEGYTVITAADGEEGVQKAMEENPDLILLDIMMPKMDGYEVCKKIREKKNTPIIMLTAALWCQRADGKGEGEPQKIRCARGGSRTGTCR